MLAPICLFVYNRLSETQQTLAALQQNYLAKESHLIIFSDGSKDAQNHLKVNEVRAFIKTIIGFKSITIFESTVNKGLATSIIEGVTKIINEFGCVIVVEDDLITSPNFLDFMNQGLDFYSANNKILSISGFSFSDSIPSNYNYDVTFGVRASSWGWSTWQNRWNQVDWEVKSHKKFKYSLYKRFKFNRGGSDLSGMLDKHMVGKINSWAIRFCYYQFENNLMDVYPIISKTKNIGFVNTASNTKQPLLRLLSKLDTSNKRHFDFPKEALVSQFFLKKFQSHHSYLTRIISKIISVPVSRTQVIVFHPALAPYRIDFFNKLIKITDAKFYFSLENVKNQKFDQKKLQSEFNSNFNLMGSGFELGKRSIRFGIWTILAKNKPLTVICSEYSLTTLSVLLYKYLFCKKMKIFSISDDSIELSINRKGIRNFLRFSCSFLLDGIMLPSDTVAAWYTKNVNEKTKTLELPVIHCNATFRQNLSNALNHSKINKEKYDLVEKKVFLYVGRLVKIKNIDFLLRAFAQLEKQSVVLVIIGEGEENENLERLAQELNIEQYCKFLGRLEGNELISWYNIAHCFVLPSLIEPYGAVVNEALLGGCRVLCSAFAGSSVLINNDNGMLFSPTDEIDLVKKMKAEVLEMVPINLHFEIRQDLMPFTLKEKVELLISKLGIK